MELRPETERLVDETCASGEYASREDVVQHAVQLLHERTQAERAPRKTADGSTRRRNWTIFATLVQIAGTILGLIACLADVESILVSGPWLTFSGMATVSLARPLCSRRVMVYGISAPVFCALVAALIILFELGPNEAQEPISWVFGFYTLFVAIPAAILALPDVFQWQVLREERKPFNWQFSLRSLLLVTTAACILIPLMRLATTAASPRDLSVFGIFILVAMGLVGLALFVFVNDRRRRPERQIGEQTLERDVSGERVATMPQQDSRPETAPAAPHPLDKYG